MIRLQYEHQFSEDKGKTWRTVGITDENGRTYGLAHPAEPPYANRFLLLCHYAAGCLGYATTTVDGGPLGEVPTCDRCAATYAALAR